jgi:hypothetical protein
MQVLTPYRIMFRNTPMSIGPNLPKLEYQCASIERIDDVREPDIEYCRNYSHRDQGKKVRRLMNVASIRDGMHNGDDAGATLYEEP